jgi:hypothetical protein
VQPSRDACLPTVSRRSSRVGNGRSLIELARPARFVISTQLFPFKQESLEYSLTKIPTRERKYTSKLSDYSSSSLLFSLAHLARERWYSASCIHVPDQTHLLLDLFVDA